MDEFSKEIKRLIKTLIPDFILNIRKKWIENRILEYYKTHTPEEVFSLIYRRKIWGDHETVSGSGSKYNSTHSLREELPELLEKYLIKSILDIPCGDFNWFKTIDLKSIDYKGADIVEDLVITCQQKFTQENISFQKLDMVCDELPKVDVILCRDGLSHLSDELVMKALQNFRRSQSKYLLVTSFPELNKNENILTGFFRKINLSKTPFEENIIDKIVDLKSEGKYMVLIEL